MVHSLKVPTYCYLRLVKVDNIAFVNYVAYLGALPALVLGLLGALS